MREKIAESIRTGVVRNITLNVKSERDTFILQVGQVTSSPRSRVVKSFAGDSAQVVIQQFQEWLATANPAEAM